MRIINLCVLLPTEEIKHNINAVNLPKNCRTEEINVVN